MLSQVCLTGVEYDIASNPARDARRLSLPEKRPAEMVDPMTADIMDDAFAGLF